jgi:hypothetical protein
MSLNIKGLGNPSKKIDLSRLIEIEKPNVILLQETVAGGRGDKRL